MFIEATVMPILSYHSYVSCVLTTGDSANYSSTSEPAVTTTVYIHISITSKSTQIQ